MPYRLSGAAKEDMRRIYRRGLYEFGEARADHYFKDLIDRFAILAQNPRLYPVAEDVDRKLRKSVCGVDVIYYEETEKDILIVRILGRQDRTKHL